MKLDRLVLCDAFGMLRRLSGSPGLCCGPAPRSPLNVEANNTAVCQQTLTVVARDRCPAAPAGTIRENL